MSNVILSAEHVNYTVGSRRRPTDVLRDVTFDVRQGEAIAIMGPSGVGKTTLCRLLAGLAAPASGSVIHHGKPLLAPSSTITISFQHYPCFPWLTVEQNALFGVRTANRRDRGRQRDDAGRLLDRLGLGGVRDAFPRELSGGMQQRLSLARALGVRPEVLILDEPFSALDPATKDDLKDLLEELRAEMAFTLIVVLHDVMDAFSVTHRALVLGGRPASIVGDMPADDLPFEEFRRRVLEASGRHTQEVRRHVKPLGHNAVDLAPAREASR